MPSACSVKNTGRFPCSVSVQEGILFRIGKCLSKLDNNIIFQIKGIVIKQFLRYLCLLYTSDAADEEDSVDIGGRRSIQKKKNNNVYFKGFF